MQKFRKKQVFIGWIALFLSMVGFISFAIWFIMGIDYHRTPPAIYILAALVSYLLYFALLYFWLRVGLQRKRFLAENPAEKTPNKIFYFQGVLLFLSLFPAVFAVVVGMYELPDSYKSVQKDAKNFMGDVRFEQQQSKLDTAKLKRIKADELSVKELSDVIIDYREFEMRAAAIDALARRGPEAEGAIKALVRVAGHREGTDDLPYDFDDLSIKASAALAAIGDAGVDQLISLLNDRKASVRIQTANSLGRMGPHASDALKGLKLKLNDSDPDVQRAVKKAIQNIQRS